MGIARIKIHMTNGISARELAQIALSLPEGTIITSFVERSDVGGFEVEHPALRDDEDLEFDFTRECYVVDGHLQTYVNFKGLKTRALPKALGEK